MSRKKKSVLDLILDARPDSQFMKMTGFDDCVIGVDERTDVLIYSKAKILAQLMKGMSYEHAIEHFEFNIAGTYIGHDTPIICDDTILN